MRGAPQLEFSATILKIQISNFLRQSRSPCGLSDSGDQTPVKMESFPVPTDNGFGCDHDEGLFPLRPKSTSGDPEELADQRQVRSRTPTFQYGGLLPEGELFRRRCRRLGDARASAPNQIKNRLNMTRSYTRNRAVPPLRYSLRTWNRNARPLTVSKPNRPRRSAFSC